MDALRTLLIEPQLLCFYTSGMQYGKGKLAVCVSICVLYMALALCSHINTQYSQLLLGGDVVTLSQQSYSSDLRIAIKIDDFSQFVVVVQRMPCLCISPESFSPYKHH